MAQSLSYIAGNQNHLTGVAVRARFAESWPQAAFGGVSFFKGHFKAMPINV